MKVNLITYSYHRPGLPDQPVLPDRPGLPDQPVLPVIRCYGSAEDHRGICTKRKHKNSHLNQL